MALFYQNLIRIRKEKHISQEKLAQMSGLAQSAISMIEQNQRSPSEQTMNMIADALGYPLSAFFENPQPQTTVYDTPLLPTERELISDFRQLNRQGRDYVLQQMEIAKKIYGQFEDLPDLENVGVTAQ